MIAINASSRQNHGKTRNIEMERPEVNTGLTTTHVVDIVFVGQSEHLGKTPKHGPDAEKPITEDQTITKNENMAKYTNI